MTRGVKIEWYDNDTLIVIAGNLNDWQAQEIVKWGEI